MPGEGKKLCISINDECWSKRVRVEFEVKAVRNGDSSSPRKMYKLKDQNKASDKYL